MLQIDAFLLAPAALVGAAIGAATMQSKPDSSGAVQAAEERAAAYEAEAKELLANKAAYDQVAQYP